MVLLINRNDEMDMRYSNTHNYLLSLHSQEKVLDILRQKRNLGGGLMWMGLDGFGWVLMDVGGLVIYLGWVLIILMGLDSN